jgi:hypothetical protein
MSTPQSTPSALSAQQQTESTALVDQWLELLARIPFVNVRAGQREWIIRHALAQPNAEAARAFVNDAMWALRFGDPLTPASDLEERPPPKGLGEFDRELLTEELDAQIARLAAREISIHPDVRGVILRAAVTEPDLDAARMLVALRLAAEEERQQGQLWDQIDHYVGELAGLNFHVPEDAQFAIMRRALSLPDLSKSEKYLHLVFKRLHDRATTPVRIFPAELELHLRRGLGTVRPYAHGLDDEEFESWELRMDLRKSILESRYAKQGATEQDVQAHEAKLLDEARATLGYLTDAYASEVTAMLQQVEDLQVHGDEVVAKRARDMLPGPAKKLRKRWQFLLEGKTDDHTKMVNTRIAIVQQIEWLLEEIGVLLPHVLGETDKALLAIKADELRKSYEQAYGTLSGKQREECSRLLDDATALLQPDVTGVPGKTLALLAQIAGFTSRVLVKTVVTTTLPDGVFDTNSSTTGDALRAWVGAKMATQRDLNTVQSALNGAVNDLMSPNRGKYAGHLTDGKTPVLHCSAGKKATGVSCTIFFVRLGAGLIRIVAVGEHRTSTTYTIFWSDPGYTSLDVINIDKPPNN